MRENSNNVKKDWKPEKRWNDGEIDFENKRGQGRKSGAILEQEER